MLRFPTIMSRYAFTKARHRVYLLGPAQIEAYHADVVFGGKVLGVPSQIRRSASASIVLLSLLVSIGERYLRANLPDRNRANRVKKGSRLKLRAFNIAQWRREFSAAATSRVLDARANKVNANFTVHSNPPVPGEGGDFFFSSILSPIDGVENGADLFSRRWIIRGWSFE